MRNPCVAHRGWSSLAPENTLSALRLAAEAPDIGWAEIDVQLAGDGTPVLLHDRTLRRTTTGGRREAADLTAEQLGRLDAGSWFSAAYRGEPVPTLAEALREFGGRLRFNIELKRHGGADGLEERVLAAVRDAGMEQRCVLTSFSRGSLLRLRELGGAVPTGLIADSWNGRLPEELRELGCGLLSIDYRALNRERLRRLREAGLRVMAWTIDDYRLIRQHALMDDRLMICTNDPACWREAMRSLPQPHRTWD
ncbi:glycerophosphodiester phosphodiesterase [Paenibacillus pasadenensis]|uniref:Glycerophosphoryl diester phosphodiesterase n=1 Tax=Paenibacillus pasadenensis TaxID=217090 RepID=A0A2N5N4P4_9BACL|nr:glycerophosphodiester phosphodiesterase family protein [Paenibacillus pasadenensis]PLT45326.1 Glycerophosphoryl diester phosphodiesterase [Paenibacillus pasadenensis]